jgi:hypothetical protein
MVETAVYGRCVWTDGRLSDRKVDDRRLILS